jgi:hypothetical protein
MVAPIMIAAFRGVFRLDNGQVWAKSQALYASVVEEPRLLGRLHTIIVSEAHCACASIATEALAGHVLPPKARLKQRTLLWPTCAGE